MKYLIIIILIVSVTLAAYMSLGNIPDIAQNNSHFTREEENANAVHKVLIPENDLKYVNEKSGYQIIFPENWKGNFVITEYENGEVCIGFYGKSKTGRMAYKQNLGRDGLDLGWIVTKKPKDGSKLIGKLGEVNGTEYFLTSPRGGAYVPELEAIITNSNNERKLAKYHIDENEINLAKQDLNKAVAMQNDLYNIIIRFERKR